MAVIACLCLLSVCTLLWGVSPADSVQDDLDVAKLRADQALNGLFHYYWKPDHFHKKVKFFFACAQIGYVGTSNAKRCSCYNPDSCVNCYRWWSAVALESVASYGIYMDTKNNSHVPDIFYAHSPYNADWNATEMCTYIDDFLWYGIAYLRVYDWLGGQQWLNRSIALHDWAWEYGWDEPCGGFWWCNCEGRKNKDNIELVQALHLAAKLAYTLPNETRFLASAERIWNWFFSYDNGHGLMSDTNLVSTGVIPAECCNSSANSNTYKVCSNTKIHGTSYNQGLFISACAYLYLVTGNQTYLKSGIRAVDAIVANYTTKDGVLIDEPRSYQSYLSNCYAGSDPGGDWYSFSGIFMLHLGYFTELLVQNGSMSVITLDKIYTLMQETSESAWVKSAVKPPFNSSNICQPGSASNMKNASFPKFHWWWGSDQVVQIMPPDPNLFFHKSQLRCVSTSNDTQIWSGMVKSEDKCKYRCSRNKNCSKYLWQLYQSDVLGSNCWIWSYNRSNHICNMSSYNWNVGVKRPKGSASCAGKCGSSEPQKLEHGVCYCDADCAKHLDCCLDYADQCQPKLPISCKGKCSGLVGQPIPGGGYCWCSVGCNGWFTDNNSDGSCCPDYPQQCSKVVIPQCLDVRSQGSALNLFLGHVTVARMVKLMGI